MNDERDELLEQIETLVHSYDSVEPCSMVCGPSETLDDLAALFEKARVKGVVRYPRP